jgi:hypothetical protein
MLASGKTESSTRCLNLERKCLCFSQFGGAVIVIVCHGYQFACLRPCSFVLDWWVGTITNRIASLIYINFD